jgi:TPP-dependent pyruvate/acetoin dehydrogenase alpha subunit
MYRALSGSRIAEQTITDLNKAGVLRGHHSGLGHESVGVAVGFAVRPDDCVQMSHRSGMMLAHARGGYPLREAVLSQFGRAPSAYAQLPGRPRVLTIVGLVGTWVPMSVGIAMADRLRGKDTVTVTFFGDGAANEGAVHEAMNLAGARRLPMVFIIENNGMAVSMPMSEATAAPDFAGRAAGYGMPGVLVDGQDPIGVYEVVEEAIERARRGEGPALIEARLIRWEAHANGIADLRTPEQIAEAHARDGVRTLREGLVAQGILTDAQADAIDAECRAEVDAAVVEGRAQGFDAKVPEPFDDAEAWRLTYAN